MAERTPQERAAVLREAGLNNVEIANYLGVNKATVRRWLNPERAERDREIAREWKARNRERMHEYDRIHAHRLCECGGLRSRDSARCKECIDAVTLARLSAVEGMWHDGWKRRVIAEALDTTENSLSVTINNMRRTGWDMPHRYNVRPRIAA